MPSQLYHLQVSVRSAGTARPGSYAVFCEDPDWIKLEAVHVPARAR